MSEHPLLATAYDELAVYLRRLPTSGEVGGAARQAATWRRVGAWIQRLNFSLKLLSWLALLIGAGLVVLSLAAPDRWWAWTEPGLVVFLAALQVKMFAVLVDLDAGTDRRHRGRVRRSDIDVRVAHGMRRLRAGVSMVGRGGTRRD